LHDEAVGAESANFFESGSGGFLVAIVMNGDASAFFGELEGDATADAAGTSSDESVFSLE